MNASSRRRAAAPKQPPKRRTDDPTLVDGMTPHERAVMNGLIGRWIAKPGHPLAPRYCGCHDRWLPGHTCPPKGGAR